MGEFRQAEGADDVTGPRFLGKPRPDAPAASSGESLFERMARLGSSYSEPDTTAPSTSGHALARGPRARSKSGSPIRELSPCYPLDLCFDWSAREALEAGRLIGEETEFRLRLQCWWDWNSQYRKEVGNEPAQMAAPSKDRNEIPEDLLANLAQLLPMLQAKGLDAIAGDILRRQGRFSEAITRFKADKQLRPEWCEKLIALARKGRPELVEI
jgi:hypothetical protein